jgi:hypothetical protein
MFLRKFLQRSFSLELTEDCIRVVLVLLSVVFIFWIAELRNIVLYRLFRRSESGLFNNEMGAHWQELLSWLTMLGKLGNE